jgi:hypothetical protein
MKNPVPPFGGERYRGARFGAIPRPADCGPVAGGDCGVRVRPSTFVRPREGGRSRSTDVSDRRSRIRPWAQ